VVGCAALSEASESAGREQVIMLRTSSSGSSMVLALTDGCNRMGWERGRRGIDGRRRALLYFVRSR
jgi:hypothetical protein